MAGEELDPRRWIRLTIAITAALIVVLDATVLNVSFPTIMRDLHTTLPSLQWAITGYNLTFGSLLIIGGRLGDVFGHRRTFVVGAALFGLGSLLGAVATSLPQLVLGLAVVEGVGAALLMPAGLAIISQSFEDRERAVAFAAWGATAGVGSVAGPVLGGFLTTNLSWRWAFGLNVVITPLAILGALVFMPRAVAATRRVRVDAVGAVLLAVSLFGLVFTLSEGAVYGWWVPIKDLDLAGVSVVPVVGLASVALLVGFVAWEQRRVRLALDPLVDFSLLRYRTYRYGLLTTLVLTSGQLGVGIALAVFLQDAKHVSAQTNGFWVMPVGICVILGSQLAGRLAPRFGTARVVRWGLTAYAIGLSYVAVRIAVDASFWEVLPGLVVYGTGVGAAGAQLTNVSLEEVPGASAGEASGANTTMRQIGTALGLALSSSLLTTRMVAAVQDRLSSSTLASGAKAAVIRGVHADGTNYVPRGLPAGQAASVRHAVEHSIVSGARWCMVFCVVMITVSSQLCRLLERRRTVAEPVPDEDPALVVA